MSWSLAFPAFPSFWKHNMEHCKCPILFANSYLQCPSPFWPCNEDKFTFLDSSFSSFLTIQTSFPFPSKTTVPLCIIKLVQLQLYYLMHFQLQQLFAYLIKLALLKILASSFQIVIYTEFNMAENFPNHHGSLHTIVYS